MTGYKTESFNSKGSYIIVELDYNIHTLNEDGRYLNDDRH